MAYVTVPKDLTKVKSRVALNLTKRQLVCFGAAAVVGGPAFAVGGQAFPVFAMPFVIRCWTFILPITQMMKLQSAFFFGHLGIQRAFWSFEVLAVFFVFWSLVAMLTLGIRLPRALRKEEAELCSA